MTEPALFSPEPFRHKRPVDLWRVPIGIWRNLLLMLLLAALGALGGWLLYNKKFPHTETFAAPISLLKKEFHNSDNPTAYRPQKLDDEALLDLHFDPQVQEATAEKLGIPINHRRFRQFFNAISDRRKGMFELETHSHPTPETAVAAANHWADSLVARTRAMQVDEARQNRDHLEAEYNRLKTELDAINADILSYQEDKGLIDEDLQVQGAINELGRLRERLSQTRLQQGDYQTELADFARDMTGNRHGREMLREKKEELDDLLRYYTPDNPLVAQKRREIEQFQQGANTRSFAVSDLIRDNKVIIDEAEIGPEFFSRLLRLNDQIIRGEERISELSRLVEIKQEEVSKFPPLQVELSERKARRNELEELTRSQASRISAIDRFIRTVPGYLSVFQRPTLNDVSSSLDFMEQLKIGGLIGGGALIGGSIGLLIALLIEFRDRRVRTPLQAAIATATVPTLNLTQPAPTPVREFWLTRIMPASGRQVSLFAVLDKARREPLFWDNLLHIAREDNVPTLFIDLSAEPIKNQLQTSLFSQGSVDYLSIKPQHLDTLPEHITTTDPNARVLCRWANDTTSNLVNLQQHVDQAFLVLSPNLANADRVSAQSHVYRSLFGTPSGLILVDKRPLSWVMRLAHKMQLSWFKWRKNPA